MPGNSSLRVLKRLSIQPLMSAFRPTTHRRLGRPLLVPVFEANTGVLRRVMHSSTVLPSLLRRRFLISRRVVVIQAIESMARSERRKPTDARPTDSRAAAAQRKKGVHRIRVRCCFLLSWFSLGYCRFHLRYILGRLFRICYPSVQALMSAVRRHV